MRGMRSIITSLVVGLPLVAAAACGGSDATGPSGAGGGGGAGPSGSAGVSGSYALAEVRKLSNIGGGGSGLPVTFIDGSGDHFVFQGGQLILGSDGTYDMKVQITFRGDPSELTDYGTYTESNGALTFVSQKTTPRLSDGTLSGDKLTAHSQFGGLPFEIDLQR